MYYNMLNNVGKKQKVLVAILTYDNSNFKTKKPFYNIKILGKPIINYVKDACSGYEIKIINSTNNDNFADLLKPFAKKYDYIALLYCDTPMLTSTTLNTCLDFAILKDINVCKLPRGYVFKSEFLKSYSQEPMQPFNYYDYEFLPVTNYSELETITATLQKQINESHMKNGVQIMQSSSTFIEPTVVLDENVVIYPNNFLSGNTVIKSETTLFCNNSLENCKVGKNVSLQGVNLLNCTIKNNVKMSCNNVIKDCTFK